MTTSDQTQKPITLHISEDTKAELLRQLTGYIEDYETHSSNVWAESPAEAAADIASIAVNTLLLPTLAAELDRWVLLLGGLPGRALAERAAELRGGAQ